jgi:repressor LexA
MCVRTEVLGGLGVTQTTRIWKAGGGKMAALRPRISPRQQAILEFIRSFTRGHGYPPTVREIGLNVGISSTSVVDYNLRILTDRGYLRRDQEVSRGISLIEDEEAPEPVSINLMNVVRIPVMGRIAAGQPIEAFTAPDDQIELSRDFADDSAYALRVRGKSMIEDLIDDGDLVVIHPQSTANNGDIVVALIPDSATGEGQVTLKRIYRETGRIRLQPANSEMQPIYVLPDQVQVQGRVTAVIRKL